MQRECFETRDGKHLFLGLRMFCLKEVRWSDLPSQKEEAFTRFETKDIRFLPAKKVISAQEEKATGEEKRGCCGGRASPLREEVTNHRTKKGKARLQRCLRSWRQRGRHEMLGALGARGSRPPSCRVRASRRAGLLPVEEHDVVGG